jgi:simple sugar transport system permease protein
MSAVPDALDGGPVHRGRFDLRSHLASLGRIAVAVVVIAVLFTLLIVVAGASPSDTFNGIVDGSLGNKQVLGETLLRFAPLALIAVALVPSLRAGLFNIGAPGQIAIGALAAGLVGMHLDGLPRPLLIIAGALAGGLAGMAWGYVPALLRARLQINEILSTLVFNFLAFGLLSYLLNGPLRGASANIAQSDPISEKAWLPILIDGTRAHIGILIALAAVLALAFFARTPSGYRLRLFSVAPRLATQAGASERRLVMTTMLIGAAAAGLAGWMQVAGVDHVVYGNVADTIGYTGLFVALLGAMNPYGTVIAAFFLAALLQGGDAAQVNAGVSPQVIAALIGLILLAVALLSARGRRASGASR